MNWDFVISPLVGAFIGAFTNWISIQMLFFPLYEKKVFGMRVPFTPGLFPKERKRIAKTIAGTVTNYFLSEEIIVNVAISPETEKNFRQYINEQFEKLKDSDQTLDEMFFNLTGNNLKLLFEKYENEIIKFVVNQLKSEELINSSSLLIKDLIDSNIDKKVTEIFSTTQIEQINQVLSTNIYSLVNSKEITEFLSKMLLSKIESLKNDKNILKDLVPDDIVLLIKSEVITNSDVICNLIIEYITSPSTQYKLRKVIKNKIDESVKYKIVSTFIGFDKTFENILEGMVEYFAQPSSRTEVAKYIIEAIDLIMQKPIIDILDNFEFNSQDVNINIHKITSSEIFKEKFQEIDLTQYLENKNLTLRQVINFLNSQLLSSQDETKKITKKVLEFVNLDKVVRNLVFSNLDYLLNIKASKIINSINKSDILIIENAIIGNYKKLIKGESNRLLSALNISKIVEEQINSFDIEEMEKIILGSIKKDIIIMRVFGAIIGFIIGFLTPSYPYIISFVRNIFNM